MNLLLPIKIGNYSLKNRIFMAPLTRCRSVENNVPNDLMATYYAQRASAGLIISEGTQKSQLRALVIHIHQEFIQPNKYKAGKK